MNPKLQLWMDRLAHLRGEGQSLQAVVDTTQVELQRVRELLQLDLRLGDNDAAKVVPLSGSRIARAIATHRQPVNLFEAFDSQTPWITVLSLSKPVRTEAFTKALDSARMAMWSGGVPSFNQAQNLFAAWAMPSHNGHGPRSLVARELVLWAPKEMALPKVGGEKTALLYGQVVSFARYGELVWSSISRRPEMPVGSFPPVAHPLLLSVPKSVNFEADYYQCGDSRFHRIWSFTPRTTRLAELQELDVDILTHAWSEKGTLNASMWLRSSGETLEDLREIEIGLQSFGHLETVRMHNHLGWNLERIFRAFVPGGIDPPPQNHFLVPTAAFLTEITSGVGSVSSRSGNWCLGKSMKTEAPVFLERANAPAVLIVAPPGQGKTTYTAVASVVQGTPNTLFILLSPTEGEMMERWVPEFLGQNIVLDLPDAEEFVAEEALFKADELRVQQFWTKLKSKWRQAKKPVGLPIYLRPRQKSLRFARYAALFAAQFRDAMRIFATSDPVKSANENFIVVWDDLVTALELGRNLNLKDGNRDLRSEVIALLKSEIWAQAHLIRKAVMGADEKRMRLWVQTFLIFHSRRQVEDFYPGLLGAMNLAIFVHREKIRLFEPERMIADPRDEAATDLGLMADLTFDIPLPLVEKFGKPALVSEE